MGEAAPRGGPGPVGPGPGGGPCRLRAEAACTLGKALRLWLLGAVLWLAYSLGYIAWHRERLRGLTAEEVRDVAVITAVDIASTVLIGLVVAVAAAAIWTVVTSLGRAARRAATARTGGRGRRPHALAVLAGALTAGVAAPTAEAQPPPGPPRLLFVLPAELQSAYTYASDDPASEQNALIATVEPGLRLWLVPQLAVVLGATYEPVDNPTARGHATWLRNHGLFLDRAHLEGVWGPITVRAGKFEPTFGMGPAVMPGLFADDFAEAYQVDERWGIGVDLTLKHPAVAALRLSGATFFRDTTIFSESAFTNRGRLHRADGGPGNTEDFSSFAVALDATEFRIAPGLRLHAGYVFQGKGRGDAVSQEGIELGVSYAIPVGPDLKVRPVVEYVVSWEAVGIRRPVAEDGARDRFLTLALEVVWRRWRLALVRAFEDVDAAFVGRTDDLWGVSLHYRFDSGVTLALGWQSLKVFDVRADSVVLAVSWVGIFQR